MAWNHGLVIDEEVRSILIGLDGSHNSHVTNMQFVNGFELFVL